MSPSPETLAEVVAELAVLRGGWIQRVDLVAPDELVVELRFPGRSLRLLVGTAPGLARVHLVERRPPRTAPGGPMQAALRRRLHGRPLSALELDGRSLLLAVPEAALEARLGAGRGGFTLSEPGRPAVEGLSPLPERFPGSEAIAARFEPRVAAAVADRLRRALLAPIEARLKRARRLRANLERDRDRLAGGEVAAHHGELLKPVLSRLRRGQREVELVDWASGAPITVPLDPRLDPRANLERLFAKAKRSARGLPRVEARVAEVEAELARLEAERRRVLDAAPEALPAIADDGPTEAPSPSRPARSSPLDRWSRRFESSDGFELRVGKGAEANDRLTVQGSRGHDLWLHARGTTGAHVLLKLAKGAAPTQEALLDAAHLAAHFSTAKSDARVEIVYTEARYVKKPKGAPPGLVTVAREKTMLLRVDPERLARLLAQRGS